MRPDFLFRRDADGGKATLVVGDAKWKTNSDVAGRLIPDRSDGYQLAAYMTAWHAGAGVLIQPISIRKGEPPLSMERYMLAGSGTPVHLIGVHLPSLIGRDRHSDGLRAELCRALTAVADAAAA